MTIDHGYGNHAHLDDLDPRRDQENDDPRDPFVFGEVGEAPWHSPYGIPGNNPTSPSTGGKPRKTQSGGKPVTWEEAVLDWMDGNPRRKYLDCANAITREGRFTVTRKMVARVMARAGASKTAKVAESPSRSRPTRPIAQSEQAKPAKGSDRARRTRGSGGVIAEPKHGRSFAPPPPRRDEVRVRVERCPSCDMVAGENGRCRCG